MFLCRLFKKKCLAISLFNIDRNDLNRFKDFLNRQELLDGIDSIVMVNYRLQLQMIIDANDDYPQVIILLTGDLPWDCEVREAHTRPPYMSEIKIWDSLIVLKHQTLLRISEQKYTMENSRTYAYIRINKNNGEKNYHLLPSTQPFLSTLENKFNNNKNIFFLVSRL